MATTLLIYLYVSGSKPGVAAVQYQQIIVAAYDLPSLHKITDADLLLTKVPNGSTLSNGLSSKKDIIGKVVSEQIFKGEQILLERLVNDEKSILSFTLPKGKRAVSVNINEQIEVAGLIRPGDRVDVAASFEQEEYEQNGFKILNLRTTKLIIQNVTVLAIGQDTVLPDEKLKDLGKTVTLALDPADVEKFIFASEYGVIRLVLRYAGDDSTIFTRGITRKDIIP